MEYVLESQTRLADLSRFPKEIKHWDGRPGHRDSTLLVLFLRKPMERGAVEERLEKTGLRLVTAPNRGISMRKGADNPGPDRETILFPQEVPLLNECNTAYFLESAYGKPIAEDQIGNLEKYLGKNFESIGAIYCLGQDDKGRKRFDLRFCPFPRSLLVKLRDGVDPKRVGQALKQDNLEIDWNFPRSKFFYLRFNGPSAENVYELKNRLAEKHSSIIQSIHFENMPMLNPQQGAHWNHIQIKSSTISDATADEETPVAVIDRGIQFFNLFSAIPSALPGGANWNAGTLAVDPGFPLSDYHGTCCAGIITDAKKYFSVVPNPPVHRVLSLACPNFSDGQLAASINYAVNNGYKVISMSLSEEYRVWGEEAITDALENAAANDCTVCISSGNGNSSSIPFPANVPTVIAVGATNHDDSRVSLPDWGSNYGASLSVCAPGVDIPTTDLNGIPGFSRAAGTTGHYTMVFSGTSAAVPHVAAVAAMIIRKCKKMHIGFPWAKVKDRIQNKADKVPSWYTYVAGRNDYLGHGRLNATKALDFTATTF